MDSVPLLVIATQSGWRGSRDQAVDQASLEAMLVPVTKHTFVINHADDLCAVMKEAFYLANTGRPGSIFVIMKKGILAEERSIMPQNVVMKRVENFISEQVVERVLDEIRAARKPLLFVGGGRENIFIATCE